MDFHCHLDLYKNPYEVVAEAKKKNIFILSVTTTPSAFEKTALLAKDCPNIVTGLGLHPELVHQRHNEMHLFDKWIQSTDFVGEVGLDGSPRFKASWELQLQVFKHALNLSSAEGGKILSVHSRAAATAVMECIEQFSSKNTIILHWFSGGVKELKRAIDIGCWFSVGPTMLRSKKGRDLVYRMPREKILLETDGPFTMNRGQSFFPWDAEKVCTPILSDIWGIENRSASLILKQNQGKLLSKRDSM